jgi:hypothetical protein
MYFIPFDNISLFVLIIEKISCFSN